MAIHRIVLWFWLLYMLPGGGVSYPPAQARADSARFRSSDIASLPLVMVREKGWELKAQMYKEYLLPYEPIWIKVTLTNVSDHDRPRPFLSVMLHNISYQVFDSAGTELCLYGYSANYIFDTPPFLAPGASLFVFQDVLGEICHSERPLPLQEYHVLVSLYLDPLNKAPRKENTLVLPPLAFIVIPAVGRDAEALVLYEAAMNISPDNTEQKLEYFYTIVREYSDTPYDERANKQLSVYRMMGATLDSAEMVEHLRTYFLRYPHYPGNIKNTDRLVQHVSREEMKRLCRTVSGRPDAVITIEHLRKNFPWVLEPEDK